jgi:hypothetical protein
MTNVTTIIDGVEVDYELSGTQLIIHGLRKTKDTPRRVMPVLCGLIAQIYSGNPWLQTINLTADDDGSARLVAYYEEYGFKRVLDDAEEHVRYYKKQKWGSNVDLEELEKQELFAGAQLAEMGKPYISASLATPYVGIEMECDIPTFIRECKHK